MLSEQFPVEKSDVKMLSDLLAPTPGATVGWHPTRLLLEAVYRLMPNLDMMNIRTEAVNGIAISNAQLIWTLLYALAYAAFVLTAACALFERRDLP